MWFEETVFYHIYPLGFCGCSETNNGVLTSNILKINDYIPHLVRLGIGAVYFGPLFESSTHGYDTKDYSKIDVRLGTNDDFKQLCKNLHEDGIKVVVDGVFNHVGREFFAFRDVIEKRWDSPYKDWFYINFDGNSTYNDGFWYEGWEGHYELVKLNLDNPSVKGYLFDCVKGWIDEFDIDGIRLDVAYMLNRGFMRELRDVCISKKADFFTVGEMIHGNYNDIVGENMLSSATNYECYKGLYSAFNSMNMFEIGHSLIRQFGKEQWCLYTGKKLMCFLDNHDVTRIYTILSNKNHIIPLYGLLMAMPGIPCIYYGSEWGIEGKKENGDKDLRPAIDSPCWNDITDFVARAIKAHKQSKCLNDGSFEILHMTNKQLIFERAKDGDRVIVMINADEDTYTAHFNANCGCGVDLLTGEHYDFGGGSEMAPYSVYYISVK